MSRSLKKQKVYQLYPKPIREWEGDTSLPDLVRVDVERGRQRRSFRRAGGRRGWIRIFLAALILIGVAFSAIRFFRDFTLRRHTVMHALPSADTTPFLLFSPELSDQFRVNHIVRKGETWGSVFSKYGFTDGDEAEQVADALKKLEEVRETRFSLRPGQRLEAKLNRRARLVELSFFADHDHEVVVEYRRKRGYSAEVVQISRETAERVAVGFIETSFASAAREAGVSYQTVDDLVDLFSDRVNFNQDLRKGDRFTVIFRDTLTRDRRTIGVGPILAAALDVNGQRLVAARYVGADGKARYFDAKGEPLGNSFLRYPLTFTRISSYFSYSRFHPILGRRKPHNGVDFAAPVGTPVRSVADGVVLNAGRSGGSGIMVHVKHNDRYSTNYLHLSKIAAGLRKGTRVLRGQVIGAVGATGLATGPHLHFGFFDNSKYVDPLKIKLPFLESLDRGTRMDAGYRQRMLHTLNHYQDLSADRLYPE